MRLFLVLVALLSFTGPLSAQPSDEPGEIELAQAKAKYETAARLYDLGQYNDALRGFRESFLISGAPALLLNIGQCYRALKQTEDAIKSFESYLRSDPDGEYREEVEKMLIDLKTQQEKTVLTAPKPMEPTPLTQNPILYYGLGGVFGASGLLLGSVSLGTTFKARKSFDENLIAQSQEQFRKARLTAVVADVFLVGGAVGLYLGYKKDKKVKAKAALDVALSIKPQQLSLQVYF
jgi:tetratricopeptide (TPR) repeat protein